MYVPHAVLLCSLVSPVQLLRPLPFGDSGIVDGFVVLYLSGIASCTKLLLCPPSSTAHARTLRDLRLPQFFLVFFCGLTERGLRGRETYPQSIHMLHSLAQNSFCPVLPEHALSAASPHVVHASWMLEEQSLDETRT